MIRRLLTATMIAALWPGMLAAQRTLTVERFQSDIDIQRNGDIEVTETIRARFTGSWNGIFRDLSLEHRNAQNRRERLDVDLQTITSDAGEPLRFETSKPSGYTRRFKIWVPGAEDATRTVVIRYVVHNALRFFEEGNVGPLDELYWNVTGNQWEVPIERAGARITLPDGAMPSQFAGYTGPQGSRDQDVDIEHNGGTVAFEARRGFAPSEGLTVAVGWAPGAVTRPDPPGLIASSFARWFPFALPIGVFALAFGAWRRTGKDPEPHAIQVTYEPPATLTPAEVGTLIDHKADMHDVTATLVDLAVRGYIHIEKQEKKVLGLFSSSEYVFHLKKPRHEWRGLYEHEQLYLDALFKYSETPAGLSSVLRVFGGGDVPPDLSGAGKGDTYGSVSLSALKNRFYKDLTYIRKAIYTALVTKGHYAKNPENVKTGWAVGAIAMLIGGIAGATWVSNSAFLGLEPAVVGVAGVTSAIILFVFAQLMPARTVRGARTRESSLGFKEFLSKVEEDRFRRMITSPELFEKYLPYAMAFKVEQRWAKAFEDIYREPPNWYSGYYGGAFHVSSFTRDMNAMSTAASSTMSSSPSGSGGGGSSGGGSGGGGGGGF